MMSWYGNTFHITGPFVRGIHRVTGGFPSQRTSNVHLWCFLDASPSKLFNKQRVLMHRHQGLNVRHGLCHIYIEIFIYIWVVYSFRLFCCLFIIVTWWYICGVLCGKWQARESTGMFGNLMATYYIMPQFIQNHSRFVMLMKTCMIS